MNELRPLNGEQKVKCSSSTEEIKRKFCHRLPRFCAEAHERGGAAVCVEAHCDIWRKWLFLFDQCSAHVSARGDGDEALQILSSVGEDL